MTSYERFSNQGDNHGNNPSGYQPGNQPGNQAPTAVPQQQFFSNQTPAALQPAVLYNTGNSQNNGSPKQQQYRTKAGVVTGSFQIFCGVSSMVLAMAVMYFASYVGVNDYESERRYNEYRGYLLFSSVSLPFWAGLCFYSTTGIIGLYTARKNRCSIIAYLVMSIIASMAAASQLGFEIVGAILSEYCYEKDSYYDYHCYPMIGTRVCHGLAALIGFVELVIGIISAAFCCHGICCGRSSPPQIPMVLVPAPGAPSHSFTTN